MLLGNTALHSMGGISVLPKTTKEILLQRSVPPLRDLGHALHCCKVPAQFPCNLVLSSSSSAN